MIKLLNRVLVKFGYQLMKVHIFSGAGGYSGPVVIEYQPTPATTYTVICRGGGGGGPDSARTTSGVNR